MKASSSCFLGLAFGDWGHYLQGLQCVDLLKIDVERAELDVLRGIADEDWHKIRQLVMEVHDDKDTLSAIRQLLDEKGSFAKCVVEQDSQLMGSTLHNLYALQG